MAHENNENNFLPNNEKIKAFSDWPFSFPIFSDVFVLYFFLE